MGMYLEGRASFGTESELRRHLRQCADCNDHFRDALVLAARLGREARRGRRHELQELAQLERATTPRSRFAMDPSRAARLRLMLIPAVFVVLMASFDPLGRSSDLELVALAGETRTGETVLDGDEEEPHMLLRGDWCETGPIAKALVRMADFALELGPETSLLVVSPSKGRFRLERGCLQVRGPCEVTSSYGVVEVHSGRARLEVSSDGLEVRNESGRLSATNAWVSRELAVGESVALALGLRE